MNQRVSTAFIFGQGKILLFHRDDKPSIVDPDCWDVIGGHADPGETPEQTLLREVKEEISLEVKDVIHLNHFNDTWGNETDLYQVNLNPEQTKAAKIGAGEGQEIAFFSFDQLQDLKLTQNMKLYLLNYEEKLREFCA